jgi:MASE1
MDFAVLHRVVKGLALSAMYCALYLGLRYVSFDQWFLPAGLRVVALCLPLRYWPYVLIGDAAALAYLRIPMTDSPSMLWAQLSPFLLTPWVGLPALLLRSKLKDAADIARALPWLIVFLAIWSTIGNAVINSALLGPPHLDTLEKVFRVIVGSYLGIMLIALPALILCTIRQSLQSSPHFVRNVLVSLSLIFSAYFAAAHSDGVDPIFRQSLLMFMIAPAIFLTLSNGWTGAAIGLVAVNLAIGQTMERTGVAGAYDGTAFQAQLGLAIASSALLFLGARISHLYERAKKLGISWQQSLEFSQTGFLSGERNLRDRVLFMAQVYLGFDAYRKRMADELKANGHYAAAMALNAEGVTQMAWFERHVFALYPMLIEEQGLYAALHAEAFYGVWAGQADYQPAVRGQPRALSVELQLAAYRCICNAFELLSDYAPDTYWLYARVWQGKARRGIYLRIRIPPQGAAHESDAGARAMLELEARARAFGGRVKRRQPHRVTVWLCEPADDARRAWFITAKASEQITRLWPTTASG